MKIIEYTIVRLHINEGDTHFTKRIQDLIEEGWQPLGGGMTNDGTHFTQSMVKYDNSNEIEMLR